ncbi:protein DEHYDRATION-INDUCED 19-like [Iris pallida]|uniref:Protein DEHYDRATION-INDUCED 19-like n=1 Tax=Iris pallida TaxID=29817 RepID=A0AAX6DNX8_IRIPA|nr:protein DEHYDRATION-INDUCED 19-like [Iris pallida]
MDSDLWISRLAAAKRHYSLEHQHNNHQLDRLGMDFELEEEVRPDFPYPYCYEDHDISSLVSHLEDDHPFESKVSSRRRRLRRVAIPKSQALSLLGRDLREAHLQVLLGSGGYQSISSNTAASTAVTDSLLSSLVLNFPSEVEDMSMSKSTLSIAESFSTKKTSSLQTWKSSLDLSLSHEEREQKRRQATVRATFVQDLLLNTLFGD